MDLSCCQCSVPYDGDMKDDVLKRVGISRTFEENALKVQCVINNKSDDKKTVRIRLEDSAVDYWAVHVGGTKNNNIELKWWIKSLFW